MIIAWGLFIGSILSIISTFSYKIEHDEQFTKEDGDANLVTIACILALCSAQYIWG